ncbi:hypothetical protein Golob_002214 [Gossypium lobatum]|uniref:At1g61320/AtMIF1 LRR domain-containing protein n=1 Tax=Gossypium lobatum TaxID=34289 RepID=A0A7J8N4R4_9ROSI|nr:hypothetical protein [Gossypium lobatum]
MFYSHDNVRSLEQVSLKCFLFNPNPPCDLPFASLKTLCFFDRAIEDETLKALVSKFPVLEGFTIDLCHRLRNFKVSWCQNLMKISFTSLPSIVEATVFQWSYRTYGQEFSIRTWLRNLVHVKELSVNSWFSQVNKNGWKIFKNLEVFSWFGPSAKECELIALIAFLGYCPSLEMIEIDFRSSYWEEAGGSRPAFALEPPFVELKKGDGTTNNRVSA